MYAVVEALGFPEVISRSCILENIGIDKKMPYESDEYVKDVRGKSLLISRWMKLMGYGLRGTGTTRRYIRIHENNYFAVMKALDKLDRPDVISRNAILGIVFGTTLPRISVKNKQNVTEIMSHPSVSGYKVCDKNSYNCLFMKVR